MSRRRHAAECPSVPSALLSAETRAYGRDETAKTGNTMPSQTTASTLVMALLLAGASTVVLAEPKDAPAPLFDAAEIDRAIEIGFLLDLNPAWQPFEQGNRFTIAPIAALAVAPTASPPPLPTIPAPLPPKLESKEAPPLTPPPTRAAAAPLLTFR